MYLMPNRQFTFRTSVLVGLSTLLVASTWAQALVQQATPPPKVTTPDVKIPDKLLLPGPKELGIGSPPLTVEEAVAIAMKKQPQVGIARANLLTAQGHVQQAASGLYPQLGASGTYAQQQAIRGTLLAQTPYSSSVTLQQLLFDFGRTRDALHQQRALELSSRFSLTRTQQSIALQVKTAFYTLVQDLANVVISEQDVANLRRELDEATARMNNGLGAPVDVLMAKTNLAAGAVSLSSARDTALASQVSLAQLMGINPRTPIEPASSKEVPLESESDIEKLVTAAMNDRPDIRSAKEQVNAAVFAVTQAKKGNLPRVDAVGGFNGRGPKDPFDTQYTNYGITVSWTFGDGGLVAGEVKAARGAEDAARQSLIEITNQAITDVSTAFVDLQSAQQRLELAHVGVANAQELVRIDEGRYLGGIGQFLDVTSAQASFIAAQHSLTQAQGDVERARASLRVAIGKL